MFEAIFGPEALQIIRVVLDIGLLSIIFYFLYRLFNIVKIPLLFNQIGLIVLAYIIASLFKLETVLWVLRNVMGWLVVGGLVVFQPELRALVMRMDYVYLFKRDKNKPKLSNFNVIITAIENLRKMKRGALLIFPRRVDLEHVIMSKVSLNADLSTELLQTIFSHETALHDGAVIIHENRITHAGCFLPTSTGDETLVNLGSRHRAALGLSQNSDAVVLVLSEEYRTVSLVYDGKLTYDIDITKACSIVEQLLLNRKVDVDLNQIEQEVELASVDTAKGSKDA